MVKTHDAQYISISVVQQERNGRLYMAMVFYRKQKKIQLLS
jgi:hypothetical protein